MCNSCRTKSYSEGSRQGLGFRWGSGAEYIDSFGFGNVLVWLASSKTATTTAATAASDSLLL